MGEFFNGWRRKLSVVTLVMAFVSTNAWMLAVGLRPYVKDASALDNAALEVAVASIGSTLLSIWLLLRNTRPKNSQNQPDETIPPEITSKNS